jgi:hypothetical protein
MIAAPAIPTILNQEGMSALYEGCYRWRHALANQIEVPLDAVPHEYLLTVRGRMPLVTRKVLLTEDRDSPNKRYKLQNTENAA